MTIPKIVQVSGSRNSENVILTCTGCNEYYSYSVRQYKGDFGCNITEFEQFLQWAKWHAAQHECFLAGRVGYIVEPEGDDVVSRLMREERHEDPFGEEYMYGGYWPDEFEDNCPTCGKPSELFVDGDCPECNPPVDRLGRYTKYDAAKTLDFRRLYEMGPPEEEPFGDNYDWEENRFDLLYGEPTEFTVTGRISVRHPTIREIPRVHSFDIEIDYAGMEQRLVDAYLLAAGVYSLDNLGCLRDEKRRCLACIRPGPHLPFYWGRE